MGKEARGFVNHGLGRRDIPSRRACEVRGGFGAPLAPSAIRGRRRRGMGPAGESHKSLFSPNRRLISLGGTHVSHLRVHTSPRLMQHHKPTRFESWATCGGVLDGGARLPRAPPCCRGKPASSKRSWPTREAVEGTAPTGPSPIRAEAEMGELCNGQLRKAQAEAKAGLS